jgi:hypothetical protein
MSSSNDSLGPERRSKPIWKPLTIETPDWLKPFVPRALVLLRHKWIRLFRGFFRAQHGHRGMHLASARINFRRTLAIELGT